MIAVWLAAWSALAAEPLTLRVTGLETDEGRVLCTLYAGPERWLKDPGFVATTTATPADGAATCTFDDVAPGTYAVSFIHDVNGDGKMEFSVFGWPKESWGVSRDAPARMGPPKFDAAAFVHPGPSQAAALR